MFISNAEMIKELNRPGKVYMPIDCCDKHVHIAVEKIDLIQSLLAEPPNEPCAWAIGCAYKLGRKVVAANGEYQIPISF